MLTNDERAALARLCGMVGPVFYEGGTAWYYKDRKKSVQCRLWHPDTDGRHTLMVMEGLVKHLQESRGHEPHDAWYWLFTKLRKKIEPGKPLNFAAAVCAAGLEIINQKGGE